MAANTEKLSLPVNLANLRIAGAVAGLAGIGGSLLLSPVLGQGLDLFWRGYLYGLVFLLSLWLGPFALLMIHHMTAGNWSFIVQRILEAAMRTWLAPIAAIALLVLSANLHWHDLYAGWWDPHAPNENIFFQEVVVNKAEVLGYLTPGWWTVRAGVYIVLWMAYILAFSRWSKRLDETGDEKFVLKQRWWAPTGIIMYCITMTFAATDWYMSVQADWFSTIYGPIFWISQGLTCFAAFILILSMLAEHKPMNKYVTVEHYHLLGTFMMAFVILWAYLNFSQYLLIWAGNVPEEISWYLVRDTDGWNLVAVGLMLFHFFLPLMFLLQRRLKFQIRYLRIMCAWILVWRLVDVFYIVNASFHVAEPGVYFADALVSLLMALGMGGIWLFLFLGNLAAGTAMPLNDPRLYKAMHHVAHPQEAVEHA